MPTSRLAPILCAAAMLAALATAAGAQATPSVDLGKRSARSKYTLGRLFAVQELADGRVVASDSKEQVFRMVDFVKGDVGLIGKQGDDSDTYRTASLIVRLGGDSLGLFDPAGRKLMQLTPQGTIARFVPLPTMSGGRPVGTLLGADASGSLYFTIREQFDTATKSLTGVASVTRFSIGADADEPQLTYRTRRADQLQINGIMPFVFRDAVAVRSDGLLARVVADTYQVIWSRNGRESGRTGPLPFQPIPIPATEQQAIKDSTVEAMKAMMAGGRGAGGPGSVTTFGGGGAGGDQKVVIMSGGGGGAPMMMGGGGNIAFTQGFAAGAAQAASANAPGGAGDTKVVSNGPINFADIPLGKFPDYKPPMPASGVVAMFDNTGMLWIARERVHGDAVPHYDVAAEGKGIVARVNLPAGTRLVGFGKNAVYLARDEDGSDWLERYNMPRM